MLAEIKVMSKEEGSKMTSYEKEPNELILKLKNMKRSQSK